ncbi:MAG: hypothetical protein AAF927_01015 [Bacteroidota bacterium]
MIEGLSYRHFLIGFVAILSLWARIDHRYHYRKLNPDTEIIMAMAAHIEQGRGGVLDHWNEKDIAKPIVLEQRAAMPGYAYLLLMVNELTDDWLRAAWGIEVAAIVAFFAAVVFWFRRLMGETATVELGVCLLLLGFSPAPLHYFPTTDMLSLTAFIWGAYALYRIQDRLLGASLLALLGLSLAISFRYAYLALLGLLPLTLAFNWWQKKNRVSLIVMLSSIPAVLMVAALLLGFKGLEGSMTDAVTQQWYPEHLVWLEPFPFKSFFYYGLPHELALDQYWSYGSLALKSLAFLVSGWLVVRIIRFSDGFFNMIFFLTMLMVVSLLIYFSIKVAPETWNQIAFWTFLMETRYYAAPMLLTVLGILAQMRKGKGRLWMQMFVIGALLAGGGVSLYQKYRIYQTKDVSATFLMSSAAEIYRSANERKNPHKTLPLLYNSEDSRIGEIFGFVSVPAELGLDGVQTAPRSDSLTLYAFFSIEGGLTPAENAWMGRSDTEIIEKNQYGEWWQQTLYPNMD